MSRPLRLALRLAAAAAVLAAAGSAGSGSAFGSSPGEVVADFAASARSVAVEAAYDRPGTTIWAPTIQFGAGYTQSSVTNDPAVVAVGASLYPGGLVLVCTEGVTGRCPAAYPLWARSTNVDEKIDAPGGKSYASPDGAVVLEAQTSHAETSSQPRALGTASSGHVVLGNVARIDSARSASESLRQDGAAVVSKAWSVLQGVSLLDGAVKIQSLWSESTASLGDGPKAASAVRVEGATFNDRQITFDDQGVRVIDPSVPADRVDEVSKAMNEQLLKHFGVKITLVDAPVVQKPDLAAAETNGLRIAAEMSEGGQGAPWCDPARGLPPITNCKQVDHVTMTLGASAAAVSRPPGGADGGLLDVGAGVPAVGDDLSQGDGAQAAPAVDAIAPAADTTVAIPPEGFTGPGTDQSYAAPREALAVGGETSSPPAASAAPTGYGDAFRPGATAESAPIARRIERKSVRPAQLALLALSWALTAACLAVLVARSRLARARAAALGL
ncbi:MAG: hypothetical protein AB1679_01980 [Actinomycetota bacterium]|jgi:hypothetical protein